VDNVVFKAIPHWKEREYMKRAGRDSIKLNSAITHGEGLGGDGCGAITVVVNLLLSCPWLARACPNTQFWGKFL